MKFVFTSVLFILTALSAHGQFEKGTFSFGGSVSGTSSKNSYPGVNANKVSLGSISIFPTVGYFVANNFLIGGGLNYQYSRENEVFTGYELKDNVSGLSLSPYFRYYIKHFYMQAGLSAGYGRVDVVEYQSINGHVFGGESKKKTFFQDYYFGIGYAIMVSQQIAIEPMVGYQYFHDYPSVIDQQENQSQFYFKLGLQVYLHKR